MLALPAAIVFLAWSSTPASAEPVSAIIGLTALIETLIGGSAITIGFASITAAQIGGTLVSFGLLTGLMVAQRMLAKQGSMSARDENAGKFNERQSIPTKRVIVGTSRVGGALFFEEVKPPYLYMGFLLSAERISGISKLWIGDNDIPFSAITENTILIPARASGKSSTDYGESTTSYPRYDLRLKVSFRYGEDDQGVDPIIAAAFTSIGSEFRQRGSACAVLRCDWGADQTEYTDLWGQVQRPSPYYLVHGGLRWDPRDPTQDKDDKTTWKWTDNPTLHAFHVARSEDGGRLFDSVYEWDLEKVCACADWDDSPIHTAAGDKIKRYTANGVYKMDQDAASVLKSLMSANRSRLIDMGGKLWFDSSEPKSPIATIHDGILMGGFETSFSKPKRDMTNRTLTRFVASDREYQVVDGPIYDNTAWQSEDGEVLETTIDLPFTDDHRIVQRIAKAEAKETRLGKSIACRCDISILAMASDSLIGAAVTFNSNLFPSSNGVYRVTKMSILDAAVDLQLEEYDPSIETDWNYATDEQSFDLPALDMS